MFEDLLEFILISPGLGFALCFIYVRELIIAIEYKYRSELEKLKPEAAGEIRTGSVNRSHATPKEDR